MTSSTSLLLEKIAQHKAKFVDCRFTDTLGTWHHITVPASVIDADYRKMFDGSSIRGWKGIEASDMMLLPDPATARFDPFLEHPTISVHCDVIEPTTQKPYDRDPRAVAKRAEAYMKSTGIADTCYMGPEPEFFVFDDVQYHHSINSTYYRVDSKEAAWNSGAAIDGGNLGHRPAEKGGYFPVPPVDSSQDLRSSIALTLQDMGLILEAHHHEVATANQNEIATRFSSLTQKADELQVLKYVVRNMAHAFGKTATFMPKPLVGDNGSGMHVHQSLSKNAENVFAGDHYAGLSELALYYIGGIMKHARTINAFTNSTTNSYKRLVPGFEAPVLLAYSERNRSAAIRIPFDSNAKGRRIEVRFPDPAGNPYLGFAAMLMAGLDGIKHKIHPGEPVEHDLYELSPEVLRDIPTVCASLEDALDHLRDHHAFLLEGNVFTRDFIDSYITLKMQDVQRLRMCTHPVELEMYYSS